MIYGDKYNNQEPVQYRKEYTIYWVKQFYSAVGFIFCCPSPLINPLSGHEIQAFSAPESPFRLVYSSNIALYRLLSKARRSLLVQAFVTLDCRLALTVSSCDWIQSTVTNYPGFDHPGIIISEVWPSSVRILWEQRRTYSERFPKSIGSDSPFIAPVSSTRLATIDASRRTGRTGITAIGERSSKQLGRKVKWIPC